MQGASEDLLFVAWKEQNKMRDSRGRVFPYMRGSSELGLHWARNP